MRKMAAFIITLLVIVLPTQEAYAYDPLNMEVHFIDVGQGDSILIQTPLNRNILIDGGPPEAGKKVVSYLKQQGIKKIDLLVATHPDIDHIGGLTEVLRSVEVEQIVDTGKLHPTKTFANYVAEIREQEIPVQIAEKNVPLEIDPMIQVDVWNAYDTFKNNNKSSIVLKLTYNKMDFLFMSDVERQQEKSFLKEYDVEAEVIKVAHHGSNTSSGLKFLQEVNPEIAILTYSKENHYGHPVDRVIENLYQIDAMIYSTAALGNVVLTTDGEGIFVTPEKNPIVKFVDSVS